VAAFQALKQKCEDELPAQLAHFITDDDVLRFIVASEGNVQKAFKKLRQSAEWQSEKMHPVELQTCSLCLSDTSSHSHIPIGLETTELSTIIYGCPARASNTEVAPIVDHVGRQLEYCFGLPFTGNLVFLFPKNLAISK
jgi:hypothetical protein